MGYIIRKSMVHHRRRGSMYMLVLGTAMIITLIGLSSITFMRTELRATQDSTGFTQARFYAQSAIDLGLFMIENDPNWRSNFPNGIWSLNQPIGTGMYTIEGIDPTDGDLSNNNSNPLQLAGIGYQGNARYKLQVSLVAIPQPLTCLEVSLHAGGSIDLIDTFLVSDQIISANIDVINNGTQSIAADVEAVGSISGCCYLGNKTTGIVPRTMPNPSTVFDYYVNPVNGKGTYIDVFDLPRNGGVRALKNIVLSPANNPYGPINLEGIYVIDLMGQRLKIRECRIVGTLVLLNGAPDSISYNSNNWEPAVPNYPVLMVRGDFVFDCAGTQPLSEWSTGVNYNPPGTPYNGVEDTLIDDEYPIIIKGLVYVSGNISSVSSINADSQSIEGTVIVGGNLNADGGLDLTYQPTILNNPPPGFRASSRMEIAEGSWRQVVD